MIDDAYPSTWVRAALDLAILGCLQGQPLHGYGIAGELEGRGMGRLKGGSLYPALARLEEEGLVDADWTAGEGGPGRKAYAITPKGRTHLERERSRWQAFSQTISEITQQEER